ncbi:hypothetical protein ACIPYQ_38940 [Streptomyces sp. NPDC090045]|uniref:hypothetical protein n=1 Tax=Streptomyces sp. NPDC090045 TaxID=3365927 RepID=UPI0038166972
MDTIPIGIDGYLDTEPVPGPRDTARFRLISSPSEDVSEESVLACVTGDPFIVHLVLTELRPGDYLHVAGFLTLPAHSNGAVQLQVEALEVLQEVPLALAETAGEDEVADELTFDRYGAYVAVSSSATPAVQLWTEAGTWIGIVTDPASIQALITAFEKSTRKP